MNLVLPDSPEYESARRPAIARFSGVRPQAIARCAGPEDVASALSFAESAGLPVAVRSGGHCFAGRSSGPGVVIDVRPMSSVTVSGSDSGEVAVVGAGARLGEVYGALEPRGLTIPAGCGPDVGISGLTLGGGLGILGRTHGLTCDKLLAAEVVLPDGRVVSCDADREADLFWALRGAGAEGFGVATSLVFATVPAPAATSFHVTFPGDAAVTLIDAWQRWSPDAPDELAASLLVVAAAEVDAPVTAYAMGAMLGSESQAVSLVGELADRAGVEPVSTSFSHAGFRDVKRQLAELGGRLEEERQGPPPERAHPYSRSEFFREPLPRDAIEALVEDLTRGRLAGETRELDFSPWGGAYNRVPADATAFVHRDARFLLKQAVVVDGSAPEAEREAALDWLARSWSGVHAWGTGGVYPNFPDPELEDPLTAYYGSNRERVVALRDRIRV